MDKYERSIDLGYGAGLVTRELALLNLKQSGKPASKENIAAEMQSLAEEAMDSYIPSPELGRNPRMSKNLQGEMAPELFSSSGLLAKIVDPGKLKVARIEISAAMTNLAQAILRHVYGLKTTRQKLDASELGTASKLTAFEYIKRGGSKSDMEEYNRQVDANRLLRITLFAYLNAAVSIILKTSPREMRGAITSTGIKEADQRYIRSEKGVKDIAFFLHNRFQTPVWFKNFDLSKLFAGATFRLKKD